MTVGPIGAAITPPAPSVDPARDRAIRSAAGRFEEVLLQQLAQVMRSSTPEMFSGAGGELYGSMFDEAFATSMSRGGGMGLTEVIARAMGAGPAPSPPALSGAVSVPVSPRPDLGPILEARPASGADLDGATGALQDAARAMLPESGVAPQWGRDGTLTEADLASTFSTEGPGGAAYFRVRDVNGYRGYYKCNLFALELSRRAGFEVPLAAGRHGWSYAGPTFLAQDAEDGSLRGHWAHVVTGARAEELDSAIVRGDRAFVLTASGQDGHRGHMGVIERVHEVEYDADGRLVRIDFDGWEGRTTGATHLEHRVWTVAGHGGGEHARRGLGRIEILELRRPADGAPAEHPLAADAPASVLDGPPR